jgi:hypothetical protein
MFDEVEEYLRAAGFRTKRYQRGLIKRTLEEVLAITTTSKGETLVVALAKSPNAPDHRFYVGISTNPDHFGYDTSEKAVAAQAHSNLSETRQRSWKAIESASLESWPFEAVGKGVWAHSTWIDDTQESRSEACSIVMILLQNNLAVPKNTNTRREGLSSNSASPVDADRDQMGLWKMLYSALNPG